MIAVTTHGPRRGVSALEFTSCFAAMVGGVFLGSMYLGVNVKEMAYMALERVNVVEPRRAEEVAATASIPAASGGPTAGEAVAVPAAAPSTTVPSTNPATITPAGAAPPADATAAAATESSATLSTTTAAEPASSAAAPPTGFFAREDLITDQQREALTRAYWDALAVCMKQEVDHRVPAIDAEGNWQLFDYLTGRKDGHKKAATAIAALDQRGVDDHVLAYAKKALAWHEDGAKLFGRAVDLLTDAPTAQLSGPFAQSWQSAATQHRMEARLLVEKLQAVKSYLDHAYQPAAAVKQGS